jgi:hypothetical protein
MLNKWQLFNEMLDHYRMTGKVMNPEEFQQRFDGRVSPEDAVEGLQEFDKFLDASRGPVSAPEMRQ